MRPWTAKEARYLVDNMGHFTRVEIARVLGRTHTAVQRQVERLRLAGKIGPPGVYRRPAEWVLGPGGERLREYHARGYSDGDIARALHLAKSFVRVSRCRMGLPANLMSSNRNRDRSRRTALENQVSRIRSAMAAEALGWPGCTGVQAKVLDYLLRHGPCRSMGVAVGLGYRSKQAVSDQLTQLLRRGLVVRSGWQWSLAPGVEPGMTEVDEEE